VPTVSRWFCSAARVVGMNSAHSWHPTLFVDMVSRDVWSAERTWLTRMWFKKDTYGLTIGGGQINNPGRYLVLIPPINGKTAASASIASPYFSGNPSDPFKAWDTSITYDYMPRQWLTFRWEYDYRHANVPIGVVTAGSLRLGQRGFHTPTTATRNTILA
jgi:Putative beta-barrel porin-2, OmpL-like. bbp2